MQAPKNYLIDMDGVLVSGRTIIPGADQFLGRLKAAADARASVPPAGPAAAGGRTDILLVVEDPANQHEAIREVSMEQVFVSRQQELQRLHGILGQMLAGRGQVCFITGEAGFGKTNLTAEFAPMEGERTWILGRSEK